MKVSQNPNANQRSVPTLKVAAVEGDQKPESTARHGRRQGGS